MGDTIGRVCVETVVGPLHHLSVKGWDPQQQQYSLHNHVLSADMKGVGVNLFTYKFIYFSIQNPM